MLCATDHAPAEQDNHEEADAILVNTCAFVDEVRCLRTQCPATAGLMARALGCGLGCPAASHSLLRRLLQAKEESIAAILEAANLKSSGSVKRVVMTGCMAQRYGHELAAELPEARSLWLC